MKQGMVVKDRRRRRVRKESIPLPDGVPNPVEFSEVKPHSSGIGDKAVDLSVL